MLILDIQNGRAWCNIRECDTKGLIFFKFIFSFPIYFKRVKMEKNQKTIDNFNVSKSYYKITFFFLCTS